MVGRLAASATNEHEGKFPLLLLCLAVAVIVDRATGSITYGEVPPYSVVVSGNLPGKPLPDGSAGPSTYCAVIVKTVDAQTRSKTGINELLRD